MGCIACSFEKSRRKSRYVAYRLRGELNLPTVVPKSFRRISCSAFDLLLVAYFCEWNGVPRIIATWN